MHDEYRTPLDPALAELLLVWHTADPPSEHERRRNDRIEALQGTRNRFIDHPEQAGALTLRVGFGESGVGERSDCVIKGNVSRRGGEIHRIYHTPSSPWYERVKLDETNGERWFCSVQEAIAAGWRAPE